MENEQSIYRRDSDAAILFVHGILGTPEHFKRFIKLIPNDWTVRNLTLKGHCGTAKDFSAASMAVWKLQVSEALCELRSMGKKIYIVAHSMGTLFALQEAGEASVEALFLLDVPLKVRITARLVKTCWQVFRNKTGAGERWVMAAKKAYSIAPDNNIFHYIGWIPRYAELFSEIRKTRKKIKKLQTPCYVYLSAKDEMVSPKTAVLLKDKTNAIVKMLRESGHFYYESRDEKMLLKDFQEFIICSAH